MPKAGQVRLPTASRKRQIGSKQTWNAARSAERADFFTLGYSGRKIEEILAVLKQHRVRTLVDIRQNPISVHRPETSKNNLSKFLARHHINYAHHPELGVPRDIRAKAAAAGSRQVLWTWYDARIGAACPDPRGFLKTVDPPAAFMCMELDPCECHRHRLALAFEAAGLASFDL
jgi:uncharacterized protein (DUF488 family)